MQITFTLGLSSWSNVFTLFDILDLLKDNSVLLLL